MLLVFSQKTSSHIRHTFLVKICIKEEFVFQPRGTVLFLSTSLAKVNAENKQL